MKTIYSFALLLLLSFTMTAVWAGEAGKKDPKHEKTPHNGPFVSVDEYHLEMLVKGQEILIYVTDHKWNPQKVDGTTGKIWVMSNKKKTEISLKSAKDNLITASGDFASSEDMKVILKLNIPDQKPISARFTPLAKMGN